jgi:translation elongation factor EF-1alpha
MGVNAGAILFKGPPALCPVTSFRAAILVMPDLAHPLIKGSELELFVLGKEVVCSIGEIFGFVDPSSGESLAAPRLIYSSRSALVRLDVQDGAALLLEPYAACPALGRFVLRGAGKTLAVGVVIEMEKL